MSGVVRYQHKIYPKICMCGSTKFKDHFIKWAKWLTLQGAIVTMPMIFGHSGDELTLDQKIELDNLHKAKILDADAIFVVNINHYIGASTKSEIEYAKTLGKNIIYVED